MAIGDVKLDGGNAIVEGNWLVVKCWDIKLDAPDRRGSSAGERRALVHGFHDELCVNYAGDYPGGVTIGGEVHIPGKIKQNHLRLESHDLHLNHPARRSTSGGDRRALVHGFNDELVLNWSKDYPGGTVVHGDFDVQKGGRLRLINTRNKPVIELNRLGNLIAGGHGEEGNITLKDLTGTVSICTDTRHRTLDFKDSAGAIKLRITSEEFTESVWPAWPGTTPPSRLELIRELRRMKEEILTLRAEVDELKSA
jgi:hypothetical protein